jgi:ABC-type nitrate/sulfonate/bicarbonate transport system permease component
VKNNTVQDWGPRLVLFAAVVGTWELFLSRAQNFLLPKFTDMVSAFFHLLFVDNRFWEALYISNQALLLGYAISLAIGIPLGLAAGRSLWAWGFPPGSSLWFCSLWFSLRSTPGPASVAWTPL